ncbi:hypothetical protein, partial [Serratia nevei]|uniref:hypothetical protein n=1 Tax=Serratia nevei TaxID=2703794 RepID=UPI003F7D546E
PISDLLRLVIGYAPVIGGGSPVTRRRDVKPVDWPALCGPFYFLIAITAVAVWAVNNMGVFCFVQRNTGFISTQSVLLVNIFFATKTNPIVWREMWNVFIVAIFHLCLSCRDRGK